MFVLSTCTVKTKVRYIISAECSPNEETPKPGNDNYTWRALDEAAYVTVAAPLGGNVRDDTP
jgi:hypothetical protein